MLIIIIQIIFLYYVVLRCLRCKSRIQNQPFLKPIFECPPTIPPTKLLPIIPCTEPYHSITAITLPSFGRVKQKWSYALKAVLSIVRERLLHISRAYITNRCLNMQRYDMLFRLQLNSHEDKDDRVSWHLIILLI